MNTNNLIILLVVIPLLGSAVCSVGKITSKLIICKISIAAAMLCNLYVLILTYPLISGGNELTFIIGGWEPVAGIAFGFDMLGWIVSLLILVITSMSMLFAFSEDHYSPMFYFTILVLLAGMKGILLTRDLFNLFVFFEILAITSYILIAYLQKSHSVLASFKYLIVGSAAMLIYLLGVFIIYQSTGSLSFSAIEQMRLSGEYVKLHFAIVAIFTGIGVRCAFIPFHTWLPEAHAYAPHPVSAILSGVMIKAAFISLWRILATGGLSDLNSIFLIIGVVTAFLGAFWALCENDAKKILAFSSVSQIGYIVSAFSIATTLSRSASLYHIISHAFSKSLLFLSVGCVVWMTGERNIRKLGGFWKSNPFLTILFLTAALSITGVPPFGGFVSKKMILESSLDIPFVYSLLFATSIITFGAYIKISSIFFGPFRNRIEECSKARKIPVSAYLPLMLLSALCIGTGLFPDFWTGFFHSGINAGQPMIASGVYSIKGFLELVPVIIGGILLYSGTTQKTGILIAKTVRATNATLSDAVFFVLTGFVAILLILWYN